MKNMSLIKCTTVALLAIGTAMVARAAEPSGAQDARAKRQELREKLKNMTPEERRAAIREWREKHPEAAVTVREELLKRREEARSLTPEQREARRKESLAQVEKRIAALQKKKADGTITEQEKQQLERMEAFVKRGGRPQADANKPATKPADEKKTEEKPAPEK